MFHNIHTNTMQKAFLSIHINLCFKAQKVRLGREGRGLKECRDNGIARRQEERCWLEVGMLTGLCQWSSELENQEGCGAGEVHWRVSSDKQSCLHVLCTEHARLQSLMQVSTLIKIKTLP